MFYSHAQTFRIKYCIQFVLISLLLNTLLFTASRTHAGNERSETAHIKRMSAPPEPQAGVQTFVRVITQPVNDIVYNAPMGVLHASVPSSFGVSGNSIVNVDPTTGSVSQPVFVGSEPNKLALSTDGTVLYAGLDGAAAVRRFDVTTNTAGNQFAVGIDPFSGAQTAADLAVSPGNSNVVAVSKTCSFLSPSGTGIVIFDNGIARPALTGGFGESAAFLAYSNSDATLYSSPASFGNLRTLTVDASGVTSSSLSSFTLGGDLQFVNGSVYGANGRVVNPATNTLMGTFQGVGSGPFVVDATVGRAYYMIGNSTNLDKTVTIRSFDINTFVAVGDATVSDVDGAASSMVRWGANGLAFRTSTQLFLIQTSLIPSGSPVPSPTPTPSATPTPSPTPVDLNLRRIPLLTRDLVSNNASQTIYASVPSNAGSIGNTITSIDPNAASVGTSIFVGSEPNKLALADNNQTLWVGLNGAASVRAFDIATQSAGTQFYLGAGSSGSPALSATDIAVMPGTPGTVAVARSNSSDSSIAVYDNGVRRTNIASGGATDIEFGSPTRLYGFGTQRYTVNANGITFDSSNGLGNGGVTRFANGLIYTANGSVYDPEAPQMKGTFTATNLASNSIMTVDAALGRAYFITNQSGTTYILRAFDLNTFVPLGQATLTGIDGAQLSSLVRWGDNGVAFRSATAVFLIQSSLINPSNPAPASTPTPTPTPVPSPTPQAATFSRQVDVPINDFAYEPASQTIYASVPSSGGTRGNTITPITPTTGALGQSVFVGSEPQTIGISKDGQVLYVYLRGALAMRRFDLATQTPGIQFGLGTDPNFGGQFLANDIAVAPDDPNTIAVARWATSSPPEGGVAIYDNGVMRPTTTPGHIVASSWLAYSTPSVLYGGGNSSGLNTMTVNSSGVSVTGATAYPVGTFIELKNGLIYSARGQAVDPASGNLVGSFTNFTTSPNSMAVDTGLNKIFFASGTGGNIIISAYELSTFRPLGQITLPFGGFAGRLVRWGSNGLALRVSNTGSDAKLYLIQSGLVSAAAPVPTGIQFATDTTATVSESSSRIDVSVLRTGDLSGSSSISYATSDGTASERSDYTTAVGTLTFGPGESTKTIRVFIANDVLQESAETFSITLSNPSGASLVTPTKFNVSINDDDFATPITNPLDTSSFYVRQHYRDFLNRDPDSAGLSFWSNEIESCGADAQCREIKRINVSAAFFLSIEFQETGYLAYRMYKVSYGETTSPNVSTPVPIIRFRELLTDAQRLGRNVQVGIGDWQTQLETNKIDYAREFVSTSRFLAAFPLSMTPQAFVTKLDQNAGGVLSPTEQAQLIAELTGASDATAARASVTRKVAENSTLRTRENNRAFVLMQYFGYLRRNPDDLPDSDFQGWQFWLNKLNNFNGDFISAEMVKSFITSSEYRKRFGP